MSKQEPSPERAVLCRRRAPCFFAASQLQWLGSPALVVRSANVLKIAPETSIKFLAFDSFKVALGSDPAHGPSGPERFIAGRAYGWQKWAASACL